MKSVSIKIELLGITRTIMILKVGHRISICLIKELADKQLEFVKNSYGY